MLNNVYSNNDYAEYALLLAAYIANLGDIKNIPSHRIFNKWRKGITKDKHISADEAIMLLDFIDGYKALQKHQQLRGLSDLVRNDFMRQLEEEQGGTKNGKG